MIDGAQVVLVIQDIRAVTLMTDVDSQGYAIDEGHTELVINYKDGNQLGWILPDDVADRAFEDLRDQLAMLTQ